MNKKRFLIIVLVLILSCLPACRLVDIPDGKGNPPPLEFEDDYLVGFMVVIDFENDDQENNYYPADDFNNDDAWCIYHKQSFFDNDKNKPYKGMIIKGGFDACHIGTTDGGAEKNGKIEIEATFYYTYQLIGQVVYMQGIYQTADYNYYTQGLVGEYISGFGKGKLKSGQTLNKSRTDIDGTKAEITFEATMTLNTVLMDYLVGARLLQFDKDHNLIGFLQVDLSLDNDGIMLKADKDCEYIMLEKDYVVVNQDDMQENPNTEYTKKELIQKGNSNTAMHEIFIPIGNGLLEKQLITINFQQD